jgi:hypothetical protein
MKLVSRDDLAFATVHGRRPGDFAAAAPQKN